MQPSKVLMQEHCPIIDLHSDLLSFLTHKEGRRCEDPLSRNSVSQMQEGNVKVQTLAIFSPTGAHSLEQGKKQIAHCKHLMQDLPDRFDPLCKKSDIASSLIHLIPAIENASAIAGENEPLENVFCRLEETLDTLGHLFYITITWEGENRFGGGNGSKEGLKRDGEHLLRWLCGKRIAVDLSHTSDRFASEIIEFIDKESLNIPLIASHSNFRAVKEVPRNLPESIAKEIIRRKGLIGITFFAPFVHQSDASALARHIEYGLGLGGESALCFGSDFFCDSDFPMLQRKYAASPFFFQEYQNSSAYPYILDILSKNLGLSPHILKNIAHQNAMSFLSSHIL
jgi:membrane dipeptidase